MPVEKKFGRTLVDHFINKIKRYLMKMFFKKFIHLQRSISLLFLIFGANSAFAGQPYSYSNYLAIPTAMNTPQWCPSDAPITYEMNQPTNFTESSLTACGIHPIPTIQ